MISSSFGLSLKELDNAELGYIYREYMARAFPRAEIKKWPMILNLKKKGVYLTFGILDQEQFIGYVFLSQDSGGLGLLLGDYYSILPQYRGQGYTVRVHRFFTEYFSDKTAMFVEIEDPFRQEDPAERARMLGRMELFEKTGMRDGKVSVHMFGVDYRLMLFPIGGEIAPEKLREYYHRIYQDVVEESELQQNMHFYDESGRCI